MNLYRSFGNLMETWVTEDTRCSDSEFLGYIDEDSPVPSSDPRTNLCSASLDSGVETASSDTSIPATSCFVSKDNAETDPCKPERDINELTPVSTSQSPSSSSSSPRLRTSRAQEDSALYQKVEQALRRTDSKYLKDKPEPVTVEEVLRRRPCSSLLPKRHTSELVRGHRSQSFGSRRTVNPSVPIVQMSEMWRRQSSISCDRGRSEDLCEEKRKEMSPGLIYLEQVCQMLEETARKQMRDRALQMERDALQEHQEMDVSQALQTCQGVSKTVEENLSSCQRLENTGNAEDSSAEPQRQRDPYRYFRPRSASDTTIATRHLRKLNADCRGQHLSTYDLLETEENDHEEQEYVMEETNKPKKNWKLKIGSFRREESTKSQQMQSPAKSSTRRRLSQLFRRRRKAVPE